MDDDGCPDPLAAPRARPVRPKREPCDEAARQLRPDLSPELEAQHGLRPLGRQGTFSDPAASGVCRALPALQGRVEVTSLPAAKPHGEASARAKRCAARGEANRTRLGPDGVRGRPLERGDPQCAGTTAGLGLVERALALEVKRSEDAARRRRHDFRGAAGEVTEEERVPAPRAADVEQHRRARKQAPAVDRNAAARRVGQRVAAQFGRRVEARVPRHFSRASERITRVPSASSAPTSGGAGQGAERRSTRYASAPEWRLNTTTGEPLGTSALAAAQGPVTWRLSRESTPSKLPSGRRLLRRTAGPAE